MEREEYSEQPDVKELETRLDSLSIEGEGLHTREDAVVEKIGLSEVERIKALEGDFFRQESDDRVKRTEGKITNEEYREDLSEIPMEQILGQRHEKQFSDDWNKFTKWLDEQGLQLSDFLEESQELFRVRLLRKNFDRLDDQLKSKIAELKEEDEKVEEFRRELEDLEENEMPITLDELTYTLWDKSINELSPTLRQKIERMAEGSPWVISDEERLDNLKKEEE